MNITLKEIKKQKPSIKRKHISLGRGLRLVVERQPFNCKRIEGVTRVKGKQVYMSFGVLGKEINSRKDIDNASDKWRDIKKWTLETGRHPKDYSKRNEIQSSELTLQEVFSSFMELHKKKVKEVTWKVSQNRLNQILEHFGSTTPLINFEGRKGRGLVVEMTESLSKGQRHSGAIVHASRCRNLLKNVFDYAIDRGWMEEDLNPAQRKVSTVEGIGHQKRSNPTISWDEVPQLMKSINENSCNGTRLTQLGLKFYLMSCIRVGVLVRLKWEWFDHEKDIWVIPPETTGLKRTLLTTGDDFSHLIPATPEMHLLMDEIRELTGDKEYLFFSNEGKNETHLNPETINTYLRRLGWGGRLTAHGWRDVPVTSGQEVGHFDRDIILRQIGHTEHKQGVAGAYDNTQFIDERREFMCWWTKELKNQGLKLKEEN